MRKRQREAIAHCVPYAYIERCRQRRDFLLEGVAALRPDIQDPYSEPMFQLIAAVASTHPDLAHQLQELYMESGGV